MPIDPNREDMASKKEQVQQPQPAIPSSDVVAGSDSAERQKPSSTDVAPQLASGKNLGKSGEETATDDHAASPSADDKRKKEVSKLLSGMCEHFRHKRKVYNLAHQYYLSIDRFCFYVPLIVMQAAVAISGVIRPHDDPIQRYIAGGIAAVSAVLMAVQMHFKYSQIAEKFDNFASEYAMLATEVFYENSKGAPNRDKVQLSAFIKRARDTEKRILDVCPSPPEWITNKVETEADLEKKEDKRRQEERVKKRAEARSKVAKETAMQT